MIIKNTEFHIPVYRLFVINISTIIVEVILNVATNAIKVNCSTLTDCYLKTAQNRNIGLLQTTIGSV